MYLSTILPVFNESKENIEEIYKRIDKVCREKDYKYEILFIDDGSSNNILDFLKSLHNKDKKVKVISFDKNYGQMSAFLAGLYFAKGDIIITMDSDLQYIPEEIPFFIEKINKGYDVVGGRRPRASIGFLSKILTFYFNFILKIKLNDHGCSYNALKKEVVTNILSRGFPLCIKPLSVMLVKKGIEIDVTYNKRKCGKSKYSFVKYICFGMKYLFSFSKKPKKQVGPPFKIALSMLD